MNKMNCVICNKKATYIYSPDLDVAGIGACKKHKIDVCLAYMILVQGKDFEENKKNYDDFILEIRRRDKIK